MGKVIGCKGDKLKEIRVFERGGKCILERRGLHVGLSDSGIALW